MKTKLISLAFLVIVLFAITPCASANAQITRDRQTSSDIVTITGTYPLDPSYYPYTTVNVSITTEATVTVMYNQLTDAKGHLHINGKASVRGTSYTEAWVYDEKRDVWILGEQQSQSSKMFLSLNELTLDSETKTSQEIRIIANRIRTSVLDFDTGQTVNVDNLIIEHVIIKLNNGELQFERSWDILHSK